MVSSICQEILTIVFQSVYPNSYIQNMTKIKQSFYVESTQCSIILKIN